MSTRSILAVPYGDAWRGRYCHSDGYLTHNGRVLWNEVRQVGAAAFEEFLTNGRGSWGVSSMSDGFMTDTREEGWGGGYDQTKNLRVYKDRPGETEPEWITHDGDKWGTEWLYVVGIREMMVGVVSYSDDIRWIGSYAYDGPEPDWSAIEAQSYEVLS